ncbi:nucleotide pyrophosphohydrolase [Porphyromonadaceae bacterium W3.11]|nr:nucleotide pyrophosphohydrolase [Porphyromonadaceae bacterium W3.11]
MSSPTLEEVQKSVDQWIKDFGVRYFDPLTNMAILTEEVGEVARVMSRLYGEQSSKEGEEISKERLADELMDVIWVVTCIANQTGCDLTEAYKKNINKKTIRDNKRHLTNEKLA